MRAGITGCGTSHPVRKELIVPSTPPRWKQAVLTWLVIAPLVVAVQYLSRGPLQGLPAVPRFLLLTVALVALMTYVLMPAVMRIARPWLTAERRPQPSTSSPSPTMKEHR